MPALSWNEIRQNAILFSREWKGARDERAEAQTFWNEFFQVFGIRRRTVAAFEEPVKSIKNTYHRIDLFWKGRLLAEHKSAGESLDKAESQAFQYIQELAAAGRDDEIPRYVILCNFVSIALYDLEPEIGDPPRVEFPLAELQGNLRDFAFFIGQKVHRFGAEDEANLKAASIMAGLHDAMADEHYATEDLERLLVRLLFCLFADDTGIFEPGQFELYIENHTKNDGSDLGIHLNTLFDILNLPVEKRASNLEEDLAAFPYVNGELFRGHLNPAGFNVAMRNALIAACRFDWSRISPAIFGSLFQGIMDAKERRQIGAHYTSERDILKVIRPLFLDELRAEFEHINKDRSTRRITRLYEFQKKLARLTFFDPACGCGNFLVVSYREIRLLEHLVLQMIHRHNQMEAFTSDEHANISQVDVHQFYGIEIGEWPARIAETALWITDHQMNTILSEFTGNLFQRIPLRSAPHIRCANALRLDWNGLLPAKECSYILGNPPFIGAKYQTLQQKHDVLHVADQMPNAGLLDYVAMWYLRAADYIRETDIRCAFVSTNSISQGEQVGILWSELFRRGIKIHFAHRTFSWQSEAKGKAHVHVVIVGFGLKDIEGKRIFEYHDINGEPSAIAVSNIAPYLIEGGDVAISNKTVSVCNAPALSFGSMANDDGNLLLDDRQKRTLLKEHPEARRFVRPYINAREFLNGLSRWCLWLVDATPSEIRAINDVEDRIERVKAHRLRSKRSTTNELAATPYLFGEIRQPRRTYIGIPKTSSERRAYIPIGYLPPSVIAGTEIFTLPNATLYHFGILTSAMHMAWVRQVCGRLKSDYRYSAKLVYNNFPWPMDATAAQRARIEECAQKVLDARQINLDKGSALADLYDPLFMPVQLVKAHLALDRAVDRCYRAKAFTNDMERVKFLFQLYEQLAAPLAPRETSIKRRTRPGNPERGK